MPFAKGNTLWKESHRVQEENKDRMYAFFDIYQNGGMEAYADKLDKLNRKEKLTEPELEYMDRMQFWAEFIKPKLARKEVTGKDGGEIQAKITVEFVDKKDS